MFVCLIFDEIRVSKIPKAFRLLQIEALNCLMVELTTNFKLDLQSKNVLKILLIGLGSRNRLVGASKKVSKSKINFYLSKPQKFDTTI